MSCEKENDSNGSASDFSMAGYAQKGQFIKGSSITAYALNNDLSATGESFPGTIKDDLGAFAISSKVAAPYLELKAEGYYFVENTGEVSAAPIYLNALVRSSQKNININLLTTITCGRIRKLIAEGRPFDSAKKQAEREAVSMFPFRAEDITVGFEEMNISEDGYANAVLLAVSYLIQEGRNAGEVQKLISDISSEFETNGSLSDKLLEDVFSEDRNVSVSDVVRNLINYYHKNGMTDFKIPPFYTLLDKEYSKGFHVIYVGDLDVWFGNMYRFDTESEGGTKEYYAVSCENFSIESDVDWIDAEVKEICSNLYTLKINIAANPDMSGRRGHLYVKSKDGEILYTNTTNQSGNGQRLYIDIGSQFTGGSRASDENKVNVNGENYTLLFDTEENMYYVEVPKTDKGYGISNMPEMVVAGKNGDVLCATFTYKAETDEYIEEDDDEENYPIEWAGRVRVQASNASVTKNIPCYAALKDGNGYVVPNPALAKLETACSLLMLEFYGEDWSVERNFAKLQVELGLDGFLSGEVTTCIYPEQAMHDPTYSIPETTYSNKSNKVTVYNTNGDHKVSLFVHPQMLSTIKCTAFAADGTVLFETNSELYYRLQKGTKARYMFRIKE
ncbi:MAG: hypothetical protein K2H79_04740 [Bacteroidaceae bacterium]|nr:hypothetical protein [Bacteroidaceae bacterium]